jgi:hypothetical protein
LIGKRKGRGMPKDDYDRIVYMILKVLYADRKAGEATNPEDISAEALKVNNAYLATIFEDILNDCLVRGVTVVRDINGEYRVRGIERIRITSDGIHYLKENATMKKVYEVLKETKDWIPGL